jgi:hypothetical protein
MKPDDSNAPKAAVGDGSPASRGTDQRVPWWRRTRNQVLAGAGTIVTGVLVGVIVSVASARLPAPVKAQPTSTSVTPAPDEPYTSSRGTGWPLAPVVLGNDYVAVTASMQPADACEAGRGWVFRQSPKQLAPLSYNGDLNSWAVRNGGIPQSGNYITLTVQARPGHTVVILSFGVKVLSRAAPPAGTAANLSGGCGGLTPSFFDVNLDKPGLQAIPVTGMNPAGKKVPAVPLPHTVTESGPEQWRLRVSTTACDCTFVPYFTWTSDGNEGTFDITNGSRPWRVAAVTKARLATRSLNGRWEPY